MNKKIKINSKLKRALFLKGCDYSLDLSKIILAGVVLVSVMGMNIDKTLVLVTGVLTTFWLAVLGFGLYIIGHQKN